MSVGVKLQLLQLRWRDIDVLVRSVRLFVQILEMCLCRAAVVSVNVEEACE